MNNGANFARLSAAPDWWETISRGSETLGLRGWHSSETSTPSKIAELPFPPLAEESRKFVFMEHIWSSFGYILSSFGHSMSSFYVGNMCSNADKMWLLGQKCV